jgi:hypothetical protein
MGYMCAVYCSASQVSVDDFDKECLRFAAGAPNVSFSETHVIPCTAPALSCKVKRNMEYFAARSELRVLRSAMVFDGWKERYSSEAVANCSNWPISLLDGLPCTYHHIGSGWANREQCDANNNARQ